MRETLDESSDAVRPRRHRRARSPLALMAVTALWVAVALFLVNAVGGAPSSAAEAGATAEGMSLGDALREHFPRQRVALSLFLLACSAFFSATEVAFFSLHKLRVRAMRESDHALARLAARLLEHPGNLLTTILMGNSIVNVLLSVVLAPRLEALFSSLFLEAPAAAASATAVFVSTAILVLFGEILPKTMVVWQSEAYAQFASIPIAAIDWLMRPLRDSMILFTAFLFRITQFSQVRPAPFMTDEEFKSVLSEGEAVGVIEEDERRMIQGILEFGQVMVREILIPRPDVVALREDASIEEALALFREQEYARIPVFRENLDHITGVLYAKDLLPGFSSGQTGGPIRPLLRKPLFVPETMSIADFIKTAQHMRMHLAVVVDEYGGTEGIVTLQDALREIVGEIGEEALEQKPPYETVGNGLYRVEGNLPLDALEELTGVPVSDEEHTTVAGFLMDLSEKVLDVGDQVEHEGVRYQIEAMDKRRVARVLIQVPVETSDRTEAAGR